MNDLHKHSTRLVAGKPAVPVALALMTGAWLVLR